MKGEIPPGDSAGFFLSKTDDDITYARSVISPTCATNRAGRLARTQSLLSQLRVLAVGGPQLYKNVFHGKGA